MASSKEPQATRSQNQHQLSMTSIPSSAMPIRNSISRHHSHSVSLGTINPSHRVTRRKSMNTNAVSNVAAVRAGLGIDEGTRASHRRSLNLKNRSSQALESTSIHEGSYKFSYQNSDLDGDIFVGETSNINDDSAVADGFMTTESHSGMPKARGRRASEGSFLTKGDGKRSSGELRCEKCGKGYKHSSCLTKHLWEHTPEWNYTSKLLISKHQQVQLLEAASVLVGMNQEPGEVQEMTRSTESDHSSTSPSASRFSDPQDDGDYSSAETTPPPMSEHYAVPEGISTGRAKRHSGNSSSFSRSYQSAPSASLPASNGFAGLSTLSHYPSQRRPSTSGLASGIVDEEEAGLAAAVESLCSFGTPRTAPVLLPADVPPVPPLPARYIEQSQNQPSGTHFRKLDLGLPTHSYQKLSDGRDVKMGNSSIAARHEDHNRDEYSMSRGADDDDDGMFGRMEGVAQDEVSDA